MRLAVGLAAAVLALAACAPTAAPVRQAPPTAAPVPPRAPPASLVGRWRVVALDRAPVSTPGGIALSIGTDTMWFEPSCAGFLWRYSYAAGAMTVTHPWYEALAHGQRPPTLCWAEVLPEQRALALTLGVASRAASTARGIELSGGGHTVMLASP